MYYKDQYRLTKTTKGATINELIDLVMIEFGITDKRENVRLRAYDKGNDCMLDSYGG